MPIASSRQRPPSAAPIVRRFIARCFMARGFMARPRAALAGVAIVALSLAGCRAYEAAPLDLEGYRSVVTDRPRDRASLDAGIERLRRDGGAVPDRVDPTDGLHLAEAEVVALVFNPDLRRARDAAGLARAAAEHAGRWSDPVLGFDAAELLSPSGPFEWALTLGLTIPLSGRLEVEQARADATLAAELVRVADLEWRTRIEVRRAWTRWSIAAERTSVLEASVGDLESLAEVTAGLERAGELARTEARLVRIELAERRVAADAARLDADARRLEVLALLGLAPDAEVNLHPGIADPGLPAEASDLDLAADRLAAGSLELAAERAAYEIAEQALRLEIRRQYPDLELGGGYGDEDGTRLLFGLSIPIPSFDANRGPIAEAEAERDAARTRFETTWERLHHALGRGLLALETARRQRDAWSAAVVPMLEEQADEVDRLAALGDVDVLLLLETTGRGIDAANRLLELRAAETEAALEIARLLGPPPSDASSPPALEPRPATAAVADPAPEIDR